MPTRDRTFRIAVRKFEPFESSLAKQWEIFCGQHSLSLTLEAVPLDLHPLHHSLFEERGLEHGAWDVAMMSTDWMAEAAETSALIDLASDLERDPPAGYPAAWSESLLRLQRFGNRVLGLPYHDGPECLIYRTDLFEDPAERDRFARMHGQPLAVPQTWEQFRRVAQHFHAPQGSLYGTAFAAFPDGHNTVYDFCLQLWTRGGELFNAGGDLQLDTPEAAEALASYRALLNDERAVHPLSHTFDSVRSGLAFAAGEVAMMVNWFGFASMAETVAGSKVKGRVGVAPVPAEGGARISLNAYWVLGIAAGSPHRDIAWNFLRHCAGPEMDKLLTLAGGIGCRQSTWLDDEVNARIPFYRSLAELHEGARELPRRTDWSHMAAIIDTLVLDAINTDEPVEAILRRAQQHADAGHARKVRTA